MPALLRARPGGIGQLILDGQMHEVETSTCAHCQHPSDIPSRRKMLEHVDICRKCMRLICLGCAGKPCVSHLKRIEAAEEAHYHRRQFLMCMGLD